MWSFMWYPAFSGAGIRVEVLSKLQNLQWTTGSFGRQHLREYRTLIEDHTEIEFGGVQTSIENDTERCQFCDSRDMCRYEKCPFKHTTDTKKERIFHKYLENRSLHTPRLLDCFESMMKGYLTEERYEAAYVVYRNVTHNHFLSNMMRKRSPQKQLALRTQNTQRAFECQILNLGEYITGTMSITITTQIFEE